LKQLSQKESNFYPIFAVQCVHKPLGVYI